MDKEDFISNWDSGGRQPYMDARPEPAHYQGHFDATYETILQENRKPKETAHMAQLGHESQKRLDALNRIALTEDGYVFLRWLCDHLSYKGSILAMTNGQVDTQALLFNEARRIVWQDIRNQLSIVNRNRLEEDV